METRKRSKKRQAILDALRATCEHPTAEQLHRQLKAQYPDLSLGTVYRNLSLFADDGDAIRVGVIHGQEHFDWRTDPHAHLVCRRCERIFDVELPLEADRLCATVGRSTDAEITECAFTFHGVCADCRQKAEDLSA